MNRELASIQEGYNPLALLINGQDKDNDSRLRQFVVWQRETKAEWHRPDLRAYRDYMAGQVTQRGQPYSQHTIAAHLATIRGAYAKLGRDNAVRQTLLDSTPADLTPADRLAMVNEYLARLENATDPKAAPVKVVIHQDMADSAHIRLTPQQAEAIIEAPGVSDLRGKRDTALLALMLCTGIREAEAAALVVDDLRQTFGGELSLRINEGKGSKSRLVPYGELHWCLVLVDAWLMAAEITTGPVFRGFYRGQKPRPDAMTTRAVEYVVRSYPIPIGGTLRSLAPHDLRRSYARLQYEAGLPILSIQQNLGHAKPETTLGYIGTLDASARRGKAAFHIDFSKLRTQGELFGAEG